MMSRYGIFLSTGLVALSPLACAPSTNTGSGEASSRQQQGQLEASFVKEKGLLSEGITNALTVEKATRAYEGEVSLSDGPKAISCASARKHPKWNSALFHNPASLRDAGRSAQAKILDSGLFASENDAKSALNDLLTDGYASGVICLGSSIYNFNLALEHKDKQATNWSRGRSLEFTGSKSGAAGYSSTIKLVVTLGSETVSASAAGKTTSLTYHYVSKIALQSSNGDSEAWNLALSQQAKSRVEDNVKALLTAGKVSETDGVSKTKHSPKIDTSISVCDPAVGTSVNLRYDAQVATLFPGIKIPNNFEDLDNYVEVQVREKETEFVTTISAPKKYAGNQALREYKTTVTIQDEGAHTISLTPIFGKKRAARSLDMELNAVARKTDRGTCRLVITFESDKATADGLSAAATSSLLRPTAPLF